MTAKTKLLQLSELSIIAKAKEHFLSITKISSGFIPADFFKMDIVEKVYTADIVEEIYTADMKEEMYTADIVDTVYTVDIIENKIEGNIKC